SPAAGSRLARVQQSVILRPWRRDLSEIGSSARAITCLGIAPAHGLERRLQSPDDLRPPEVCDYPTAPFVAKLRCQCLVGQHFENTRGNLIHIRGIHEKPRVPVNHSFWNPTGVPADHRLPACARLEKDYAESLDVTMVEPGSTRHHEDVAQGVDIG